MPIGMYQYTQTGLTHIYLKNGFEHYKREKRGDSITIHDCRVLDQAIAIETIHLRRRMIPAEWAMLRLQLDLDQPGLAQMLGISPYRLKRWEHGTGPHPGKSTEIVLRVYTSKRLIAFPNKGSYIDIMLHEHFGMPVEDIIFACNELRKT